MGKFFNTIVYGTNVIMAFLLLLSFVIPYVPPSKFPTVSLLSLLVPVLLLINFVFVLYWAFQLRRKFLLSTIILILSYFHFNAFYKISSEGDPSGYENKLSVMSYNVRLFNKYEKK